MDRNAHVAVQRTHMVLCVGNRIHYHFESFSLPSLKEVSTPDLLLIVTE
jgi:hypothetical protein